MMTESKRSDALPLEEIESKLAALYVDVENYFSADPSEKKARVQAKIDEIVADVGAVGDDAPKGRVAYVHGKALEAAEAYSKEAEDLLSKAVKLDPDNIDAWNTLGNCFWKKKDFTAAKTCFLDAHARTPNAKSLRNLSMVLRQLGSTPEEKNANVRESVEKAKEAIALDVSDDESWYVLGNAYLTLFFTTTHNTADLTSALKAYGRADESGMSRNPDLHFNRAMVYKFQEDYTDAVAGFQAALAIDPSTAATEQVDDVTRHVTRVADLVARKGRVKAKKLAQLVASMPSEKNRAKLEQVREATEAKRKSAMEEAKGGAGEAGAGEAAAEGGEALASDALDAGAAAVEKLKAVAAIEDVPEFATVSELKEGANPKKWVMLKMLVPVLRSGQTPQTLVMVDEKEEAVAVSLYHTDEAACNTFTEKDNFVVIDPLVKRVELAKPDGSTIAYTTLSVTNPLNFTVNDSTLSAAYVHASLKITNVS